MESSAGGRNRRSPDWGYFQDIPSPLPGSFMAELYSMDLGQLVMLATDFDSNVQPDTEQLKFLMYANYCIYLQTMQTDSLDQAMKLVRKLLERSNARRPDYDPLLRILTVLLANKAGLTFNSADLQAAAENAQQLLDITDYWNPEYVQRWDGLRNILTVVADVTKNRRPLEIFQDKAMESAVALQTLHKVAPEGIHGIKDKRKWLKIFKDAVAMRYMPGMDDKQRDGAVDMLTTHAELLALDTGDKADAAECDRIYEKSIEYAPDQFKAYRIYSNGRGLRTRYERFFRPTDIQQSVRKIEAAIVLEKDHEFRIEYLHSLRDSLITRFRNRCGRASDAERATRIVERLLDRLPEGHDRRLQLKVNLASDLAEMAEAQMEKNMFTDYNILDRAVSLGEEIISHVESHPYQPGAVAWLGNISNNSRVRYFYTRDSKDLDRGIKILERALEISQDSEQKPQVYCNLANLYGLRNEGFGDPEDLERQVRAAREALALTKEAPSVWQFRILGSVQRTLWNRYYYTQDEDLIHEIVKLGEDSVRMCADGYGHKNDLVFNLAGAYALRFMHLHNIADFRKAIYTYEKLLDEAVPDDMMVPHVLERLADIHIQHYHSPYTSPDDLDMAIIYGEQAFEGLADSTDTHERRVHCLNLLSMAKHRKWEHHGNRTGPELDEAISHLQNAISLSLQEGVGKARYEVNLGDRLMQRYNMNIIPKVSDVAEAYARYKRALQRKGVVTEIRLRCGAGMQSCLITPGWTPPGVDVAKELADIAEETAQMLPLLGSRALNQHDQQKAISYFSKMCAKSVENLFNAGTDIERCLEVSEAGRGIINGQKFDSRADVSALAAKYPKLAQRFIDIRDELDRNATKSDGNMQNLAGRSSTSDLSANSGLYQKYDITNDFDKVVKEIRGQPGFEGFLKTSSATDFKVFSKSPREAIVVINVGDSRCDAIIVQSGAIRHLPLPGLQKKDIESNLLDMKRMRRVGDAEYRRRLSRILRWLWTSTVLPILDHLGFKICPTDDGEWPHVWWIPTQALTQLPLHAAGFHSSSRSADSALNRAISSYSSSIKALMYTRRNLLQRDEKKGALKEILLTSMRQTAGANDLIYAEEEVVGLEKVLRAPVAQAAGVKVTRLSEPTKAELTPHLTSCAVFHFAGHGMSDLSDPSKSRLLLKDCRTDPFTVRDLIGLNLWKRTPWLAYLSACSTGESQSEDLYDESIHLMGACHSAGFQHVIGSLWEVSDRHSLETALEVYTFLRDQDGGGLGSTGDVALALHKAVRRLRGTTGGRGSKRGIGLQGAGDDGYYYSDENDDVPDGSEYLEQETDDGNIGCETTRGSRGINVTGKKTSKSLGDPLIWAAYIHVGI